MLCYGEMGAAYRNFNLRLLIFSSYHFEITFRSSEDLTLPQSSLTTFPLLLKRKLKCKRFIPGRNGKEEEESPLLFSLPFPLSVVSFNNRQVSYVSQQERT